jgi:lipopolysaccharide cholinephosphotransferase
MQSTKSTKLRISMDPTFLNQVYPLEIFSKSINWKFEQNFYPVPEKYKEILKIWYGDFMKLPPEHTRNEKLTAYEYYWK